MRRRHWANIHIRDLVQHRARVTGGELWHPLSAVHVFGLLFATLLTLVLLPVLYFIFCAKLKWIK